MGYDYALYPPTDASKIHVQANWAGAAAIADVLFSMVDVTSAYHILSPHPKTQALRQSLKAKNAAFFAQLRDSGLSERFRQVFNSMPYPRLRMGIVAYPMFLDEAVFGNTVPRLPTTRRPSLWELDAYITHLTSLFRRYEDNPGVRADVEAVLKELESLSPSRLREIDLLGIQIRSEMGLARNRTEHLKGFVRDYIPYSSHGPRDLIDLMSNTMNRIDQHLGVLDTMERDLVAALVQVPIRNANGAWLYTNITISSHDSWTIFDKIFRPYRGRTTNPFAENAVLDLRPLKDGILEYLSEIDKPRKHNTLRCR